MTTTFTISNGSTITQSANFEVTEVQTCKGTKYILHSYKDYCRKLSLGTTDHNLRKLNIIGHIENGKYCMLDRSYCEYAYECAEESFDCSEGMDYSEVESIVERETTFSTADELVDLYDEFYADVEYFC